MRIKSLKLYNVKSYQQAHLEFSPKMNIIIGDNNSGKSTIIRTIDRLQGQSFHSDGFVRNGRHTAYGEVIFCGVNGRYFDQKLKVDDDDYFMKNYPELDLKRIINLCSTR